MFCRAQSLRRSSAIFVLVSAASLMPACGSATSSSPKALASISVTPPSATITQGQNQQFTATGTYSDSTTQDITSSVTWSSSAAGVATISNTPGANGLAAGVGSGSANIQATMSGVPGSAKLIVQPSLTGIAATPANASVPQGQNEQFTATGTYSNSTTQNITSSVTWSSSATNIATISNTAGTNGLATTINLGSTTIQAMISGVTGSTKLTVQPVLTTITVTPANPSVPQGQMQQFTATGTYSDSSTQNNKHWNVVLQTTTVATISHMSGLNRPATAMTEGSSTIQGKFGTSADPPP